MENPCHLMILHVHAHMDKEQGKYQSYYNHNKDELEGGIPINLKFHFGPYFQLTVCILL